MIISLYPSSHNHMRSDLKASPSYPSPPGEGRCCGATPNFITNISAKNINRPAAVEYSINTEYTGLTMIQKLKWKN
jgi:hypothetical protein